MIYYIKLLVNSFFQRKVSSNSGKTTHNSDLTLRCGTYALARSTTHSSLELLLPPQASFQSLTSLPGTQGRGTSLSLVRYTTFVGLNFKKREKYERKY
ncbi:hypothetical protein EHQ94_01980 [Leptospira meyeri]|nr:hypothetical protein EHQ93_00080 [Leptospira meyeri]TGM72081.1 hypothetical protein EHQ94_01980 [Leptospira meyeri]